MPDNSLIFVTMRGTVTKSTGSWYSVRLDDGRDVDCRMKGKFRIQGIKSTNPIAVGDLVEVEPSSEGFLINKIHDRKNYIVRRSVNLSKKTSIIGANLDQAVLVVSLAFPRTLTGFIDRFLATAEAYDIPAVVVFNKIDIYDEALSDELEYFEVAYETAGYQTLRTSVISGEGIEDFKMLLRNKVSLLSGNSGVGKSSLVNAIDNSLNLRTGDVSDATQQGQHTTTFAEMFFLKEGGSIIDSPGIRGFGLVDMEKEEIGDYFPEIFKLKENCRFHNCLHLEEPGCAVKDALEQNLLAPTRYESYKNMVLGTDDDNPYRHDIHA